MRVAVVPPVRPGRAPSIRRTRASCSTSTRHAPRRSGASCSRTCCRRAPARRPTTRGGWPSSASRPRSSTRRCASRARRTSSRPAGTISSRTAGSSASASCPRSRCRRGSASTASAPTPACASCWLRASPRRETLRVELVLEAHYHGDTALCAFGPDREHLLAYRDAIAPHDWAPSGAHVRTCADRALARRRTLLCGEQLHLHAERPGDGVVPGAAVRRLRVAARAGARARRHSDRRRRLRVPQKGRRLGEVHDRRPGGVCGGAPGSETSSHGARLRSREARGMQAARRSL